MNQPRLKIEHFLYAAAFLLALVVRFAGAGAQPLSNHEAGLALQALALARGQDTLIGPHPAYLALTTAMMFLFNAQNWVARFWPALAGGLLVLTPALFRRRLGKLPAVLMAFFLALDPGLLAISRQADSLSLALFFTMLAFGLWINGKTALAGISAGMALLSGPAVWPGIIGLGAAAWIAGRIGRSSESSSPVRVETVPPQVENSARSEEPRGQENWKRALLFALAAVFFAGTLFFTIPDGLSAMADSIPAYLRGWAPQANAGVPVSLLIISLLVYELFPLVFGVWGGLSGLLRRGPTGSVPRRIHPVDRFLLIWWAIALLLALAYPGRMVQDLAWSLLPLWALASRQITRLVSAPAYDRLPTLGQMVLAAVILGYISNTLVSVGNGVITNPLEYRVRLAGALVMLAASAGLIAWGWSRMVALRGVAWGLAIVLFLYMLSAGWNAVGLSGRTGEELWTGEPGFKSGDLLLGTIRSVSQTGPQQQAGGPDVVVVGSPYPALQWLLRGVERVHYTSQIPSDSSPAFVITGGEPDLALATTYRGQNFVLSENIGWNRFRTADWLRWLALRTAPAETLQQQQIILWARTDLFPGSTTGQ